MKLSLILLFVSVAAATNVPNLYEERDRIAKDLMKRMEGPIKFLPPASDIGGINVTCSMMVRNIFDVDEMRKTWRIQLTMRQEWFDNRLTFTVQNPKMKYLNYGNPKDIWTPDLFFKEEIGSHNHDLMVNNNLLRIFPDGHVLWSKRITLTLLCPQVDFRQKEIICPLSIASYMLTKEELDVNWKTEEPIEIMSKDLAIPRFVLNGVSKDRCDTKTNLGKFGCISARFNIGHDICLPKQPKIV